MKYRIPFYKPYFPEGSRKYAHEALNGGWVAQGKYVRVVEDFLRSQFGYNHVVLTSSGTAALMIVRCVLQTFLEVDTIYLPTNCYVAPVNMASVFKRFTYPIGLDDWAGNLEDLAFWRSVAHQGGNTVVMVVHNLGNVLDVPTFRRENPTLHIVEDACEAFGGQYYSTLDPVGSAGLCGTLSFYGSKTITCGEGGAFLTNDDEIAMFARSLISQGATNQHYIHKVPGYNFRMSNLQAALLFGQLYHFDAITAMKQEVINKYRESFPQCSQSIKEHSIVWAYGVVLPAGSSYEAAKGFFDEAGIEIRPFFYPINHHRHTRSIPIDNQDHAEYFSQRIILLPSYPTLAGSKDQEYIIEKVKEYADSIK